MRTSVECTTSFIAARDVLGEHVRIDRPCSLVTRRRDRHAELIDFGRMRPIPAAARDASNSATTRVERLE